ncbi:mandelate racemase/muconate lactonizing enzyme family protein [Hespellia stercorisuis]|uniref:Mandelate racemase n=1 Tax=Hespellia stercorisuis DSM 15480 TaxID=1121950 RepID=A0A1M6JWH9_9FIRM|nr:mandelate racemase/muconate lactonizing enzyme family protein [Hespellia stercorisuis]SHJ51050.1 mandelate racemase [Hespellia stercorisuis DSM 15480]
MKVTKIEVFHIHTRKTTGQRPIIVRVDTDAGIYGLGEVGLAYGAAGHAGAAIIKDLAKYVLGRDPFDTEKLWNDFLTKTFWGQGGGTVMFSGISALDIALWDIKAKSLGVPLYRLLGGKVQEDLRVYASQIQFTWNEPGRRMLSKTEEYAAYAKKAVAEGYDCVKADVLAVDQNGAPITATRGAIPHAVVKLGAERVAAIRKAIGDDADIIVENHGNTDTASAIEFAKAIEPYRILYYEEVNSPLNPELTERVKEKTSIPLAAGERIYSRYGYLPFLRARSLDLLQPDLGSCGGVSEFKKISDAAAVYDVGIQAHVAGTAIMESAAVHAEISIPNFVIHEHHQKAFLDEYRELVTVDYQPVNGRYRPLEAPGIGIDITPYVYEHSDRFVLE